LFRSTDFVDQQLAKFDRLDGDRSGKLSPAELAPVLVDLCQQHAASVSHHDYVRFASIFDHNGDGVVSRAEFLDLTKFLFVVGYLMQQEAARQPEVTSPPRHPAHNIGSPSSAASASMASGSCHQAQFRDESHPASFAPEVVTLRQPSSVGQIAEVFLNSASEWVVGVVVEESQDQAIVTMRMIHANQTKEKMLGRNDPMLCWELGRHVQHLPPGWVEVPSESRKGEFSYLNTRTNTKYQTAVQAWQVELHERLGEPGAAVAQPAGPPPLPAAAAFGAPSAAGVSRPKGNQFGSGYGPGRQERPPRLPVPKMPMGGAVDSGQAAYLKASGFRSLEEAPRSALPQHIAAEVPGAAMGLQTQQRLQHHGQRLVAHPDGKRNQRMEPASDRWFDDPFHGWREREAAQDLRRVSSFATAQSAYVASTTGCDRGQQPRGAVDRNFQQPQRPEPPRNVWVEDPFHGWRDRMAGTPQSQPSPLTLSGLRGEAPPAPPPRVAASRGGMTLQQLREQ